LKCSIYHIGIAHFNSTDDIIQAKWSNEKHVAGVGLLSKELEINPRCSTRSLHCSESCQINMGIAETKLIQSASFNPISNIRYKKTLQTIPIVCWVPKRQQDLDQSVQCNWIPMLLKMLVFCLEPSLEAKGTYSS
jgi:hypothetical protein